jgi:beta-lactamase class A
MAMRPRPPGIAIAAIVAAAACSALVACSAPASPAGDADPPPAPMFSAAPALPSPSADEPPTQRQRSAAAIVADVSGQVRTYFAGAGGNAALAVVDRVTGIRVAVNPDQRFRTASIVKVDILATLLWMDQRAGRTLTAAQRDLAKRMITASDNNAADALWVAIGRGPGLAAGNRAFGLTDTTPGNLDYWGATFTTVGDQLRILGLLTDSTSPLTAPNRDYVLDLMGEVEADQRWGVPAAAGAAEHVYVKNGWLATPTDNGLWIVNSIGRIVEPGHDFLVVTLSYHHETEEEGIELVERAAKIAVGALRAEA